MVRNNNHSNVVVFQQGMVLETTTEHTTDETQTIGSDEERGHAQDHAQELHLPR